MAGAFVRASAGVGRKWLRYLIIKKLEKSIFCVELNSDVNLENIKYLHNI